MVRWSFSVVDHGVEPLFGFVTVPDSVIGSEVEGGVV